MNILQLKDAVDNIIRKAKEDGNLPEEVIISTQIDDMSGNSVFSSDGIELMYDNYCQVSGCVLVGIKESVL